MAPVSSSRSGAFTRHQWSGSKGKTAALGKPFLLPAALPWPQRPRTLCPYCGMGYAPHEGAGEEMVMKRGVPASALYGIALVTCHSGHQTFVLYFNCPAYPVCHY